jgi:Imidazolonepropionase and related amidohydrolases
LRQGQAGRAADPGDRGRAYKAGVKIAFGTDAAVYPHGMNAKEFVYMVEAGMPTMFVIQAATTHAAQLLKHEKELGSVAPGKFADVIAVPGNPLDDITLLQKVNFVMKAGKVYAVGPKPQAAVAQATAATASPEELEGF